MSRCVASTCPYCGVGCGVSVQVSEPAPGQRHISVQGDNHHPANFGRLCVKGSALADTLGEHERLLEPSIAGQSVNWDTALSHVASEMQRIIRQHGSDAVAFYVSGQLLTEDYYVANKLMKGFIGSANIDTNSRLCMSTAVAAYKRALGSDTVPGSYQDMELANLLVLVGSNMAWTHPVIFQRIMAARAARPDMKIVVIDPRRTATAESADLHLAIQPGSDGYLFDGLLHFLIENNAVDQPFIDRHTNDFSLLRQHIIQSHNSVAEIAAHCALPADKLRAFYQLFADTPRTVTVFSQGINQSASGVDKATGILNCHLVSGRIGKPGATPFSITGQPNAMGGREVGGLANQLAAHMELENPHHHALVSRFWQSDVVPRRPGKKAVDMFRAVGNGEIRFVWIMATNPLVSLPDSEQVRAALAACECVVVSDCVADTDTLRLADVRLPAAGWGEKDGTVTNSERCISRQRAFLPAPGSARPDWWIICQVAQRLGHAHAFNYRSPADIFREHAALSAYENNGQRDFDIGALADITDQDYDQLVPVQWPLPHHSPDGHTRLFGNGHFFTSDSRARFIGTLAQGAACQTDQQWPLLLNTGRIRDQWHTMTRTARSSRLLRHIDEPFVELHGDDMSRLQLRDKQLVRVSSRQGECVVRARAHNGQQPGTAFMPMHWNDCFASAARADALVAAICDPLSGQPAFKQTPVAVTPLPVRWHALLISRRPLALPANQYWCRRQHGNWQLWRLAGNTRLSLAALKEQWRSGIDQWAELDDSTGLNLRLIGYYQGQPQLWLALARQDPQIDEDWLLAALEDGNAPALALARGHLGAACDQSPLVCSCHQVRQSAIEQAIVAGCDQLAAIGAHTRAGTNCGSCIPEIRKLLGSANTAPAPSARPGKCQTNPEDAPC